MSALGFRCYRFRCRRLWVRLGDPLGSDAIGADTVVSG